MVAELADKIAGLTIAQAVELKNVLKDKYGIEPAAGGAVMMAGPAAAAPVEKAAEPTEFNVVLEGVVDAPSKIKVIKVVRELTGQGLAEAKATVEGAPKNINRRDPARHPVQRPPDRRRDARPVDLRARADREAVFGSD